VLTSASMQAKTGVSCGDGGRYYYINLRFSAGWLEPSFITMRYGDRGLPVATGRAECICMDREVKDGWTWRKGNIAACGCGNMGWLNANLFE